MLFDPFFFSLCCVHLIISFVVFFFFLCVGFTTLYGCFVHYLCHAHSTCAFCPFLILFSFSVVVVVNYISPWLFSRISLLIFSSLFFYVFFFIFLFFNVKCILWIYGKKNVMNVLKILLLKF
jgi:hypothetical protein